MLYLKRKVDEYLEKWKADKNRKPLIVKGPRQVGKTESINRFAEKNYKSVIYINFVEEPKYKGITEDGYKTDDIIKNISLINPSFAFISENTLLFFDEIQEYPEIATALKFFGCLSNFVVSALPFMWSSLSRFCGFAMSNFVVTAITFCGFKMVEPFFGSTIFFFKS